MQEEHYLLAEEDHLHLYTLKNIHPVNKRVNVRNT